MGKTGWIGAAVGLLAMAGAEQATAQRPEIGFGGGGGALLGSRLIEHSFTTEADGRAVDVLQRVDLTEFGLGGFHAEWYPGEHFAVRGQAAFGSGQLQTTTIADRDGDAAVSTFETGFRDVSVLAASAGLSIWPWTPRTVGFAPFVSVGWGVTRYGFGDGAGDAFLRARGERSETGLVVGLGADMHVWHGVALRFEALNHMTKSPLDAADFATAGERRPTAAERLGGRISNVRLVLGAHLYLPFGDTFTVPE